MSYQSNVDVQLIAQALAAKPGLRRIVVGLSGGLDSTALLHLTHQWWLQQPADHRPALHAIHINHQLQPQAEQWQQQCAEMCARWQIECTVRKVLVNTEAGSLETVARQARYAAFREFLQSGDGLLLAHHRDDQVETMLQRLARGSGPLGLGAMTSCSEQHGFTLLRPLLAVDRVQLEQFAHDHDLAWVDDPSNRDPAMERNFIRLRLLPQWRNARPQLNQALARSARLARESALLLDELAALDLGQPRADGGLQTSALQGLGLARQKNLLRYWLRRQGVQPPSETITLRILNEVLTAAPDGQPLVAWGHNSVRRYQSTLYALNRPLPEPGGLAIPVNQFERPHALPLGRLLVNASAPAFSRRALLEESGLEPLTVRFRRGGERLQLPGRPMKPLKDLFQEEGVPPWLRGLWPILWRGDQIAGLPGLWVCEGFLPQSGDDQLGLLWDPGDAAQD